MDLFNQEMSLSYPEGRSRATVFPVSDMGFLTILSVWRRRLKSCRVVSTVPRLSGDGFFFCRPCYNPMVFVIRKPQITFSNLQVREDAEPLI